MSDQDLTAPTPADESGQTVTALLEEEARREGISVAELLDRLVRLGRRSPLVDQDPQPQLVVWPPAAPGGPEKTFAIRPVGLDFAHADAEFGAPGYGKTSLAVRQLAERLAFEEREAAASGESTAGRSES